MKKYAIALTFLLVVSGCVDSSDTATPVRSGRSDPTTIVTPTTTPLPNTESAPATTTAVTPTTTPLLPRADLQAITWTQWKNQSNAPMTQTSPNLCDDNLVQSTLIGNFGFSGEVYSKIDTNSGSTVFTTGLIGTYHRFPVQNDWHKGVITKTADCYTWTNDAGVSWGLNTDLQNCRLLTSQANPYFSSAQYFILGTKGLNTCADAVREFIPETVKNTGSRLKGYLTTSSSVGPSNSNYGQSFYTGIWSTFEESQPSGFQRGHGTWIIPDNHGYQEPLCPVGTTARDNWPERAPSYGDVFQTIEGGPGYWVNTQFPDPQMKYRINLVTDCYTTQTSSPGWNWGGSDTLDNQAGIAQISNRLLYPPDGITFARGTNGDFLGQAWMTLPLTAGVTEDPSLGINNWTLFLNALNFSGPTVYMTPEGWNRITDGYPPAEGRGLDSQLPKGNRSWHLSDEIGWIDALEADLDGVTYSRLPKMKYPVDDLDRTIYHQDLKTYSKVSIYDDVFDSVHHGAPLRPTTLDSKGAFSLSIESPSFGWTLSDKKIQGLEDVLELSAFADGSAWGVKWLDSETAGVFPQYFSSTGTGTNPFVASENSVPLETQLTEVILSSKTVDRSYEPPSAGWPKPENGLVYATELIDGSTVSYGWYRFVEQPSIRKLNLSEIVKAQLQSVVQAIHTANWGIENPVLEAPTFGNLAEIDSALILTPPAGMEVGYVPVALSQVLTAAR